MKKCANCSYLWADDYSGTCLECGAPMGNVSSPQNLGFAFARQIQDGVREDEFARRAGNVRSPQQALEVYGGAKVNDAILERAREMIVQREEVRYEDDAE